MSKRRKPDMWIIAVVTTHEVWWQTYATEAEAVASAEEYNRDAVGGGTTSVAFVAHITTDYREVQA
jgi:hypothetical protein